MFFRRSTGAVFAVCVALFSKPALAQESPVLFVDGDAVGARDGSSWADAFADLRAALFAARGDPRITEIWVAEGVYHPAPPDGSRRRAFWLINGVGIYGGFGGWETDRSQRNWVANVTVLSGDLNDNDGPNFAYRWENSYQVLIAYNVDRSAVIDGFTIAAGNSSVPIWHESGAGMDCGNGDPTIANCVFRANIAFYGAGLYCDRSDPLLTNCTFDENFAVFNGGGLYNLDGRPEMTACAFLDNAAGDDGGGTYNDRGSLKMTGCAFQNNSAGNDGGAMYNDEGYPELARCDFTGNSAGHDGGAVNNAVGDIHIGILTLSDCTLSSNAAGQYGGALYNSAYLGLESCTFADNTALKGGAVWSSRFLRIASCLFVGNTATSTWGAGGGLYTRSENLPGNSLVIHCTFWDNRAENGYGGGAFAGNINESFANCIFWNNRDVDGMDESAQIRRTTGLLAVDYSCVQGLSGALGGTGNIGAGPRFVDPAGRDFHLSPASPCIDSGDPNFGPGPGSVDIDRQFRIWNGRVDIGADEFGSFGYGDMNCDSALDGADIDVFFLALGDGAVYDAAYPDCDRILGDMNGDGDIDGGDIDAFFVALIGG